VKVFFAPRGGRLFRPERRAILLALGTASETPKLVERATALGWYWRGVYFAFVKQTRLFDELLSAGCTWDALRREGLGGEQRLVWEHCVYLHGFASRATLRMPVLPYSELQGYRDALDFWVSIPALFGLGRHEYVAEETYGIPFWTRARGVGAPVTRREA
jgi:hypothetical protein